MGLEEQKRELGSIRGEKVGRNNALVITFCFEWQKRGLKQVTQLHTNHFVNCFLSLRQFADDVPVPGERVKPASTKYSQPVARHRIFNDAILLHSISVSEQLLVMTMPQ